MLKEMNSPDLNVNSLPALKFCSFRITSTIKINKIMQFKRLTNNIRA